MKLILIMITTAAIAFVVGFWCGRYPLTERAPFTFWARRREAMRRHY